MKVSLPHNQEIVIECTWGFAKDVAMCVMKDGQVKIDMDLSSSEAKMIAKALLDAAARADELDRSAEEYFSNNT